MSRLTLIYTIYGLLSTTSGLGVRHTGSAGWTVGSTDDGGARKSLSRTESGTRIKSCEYQAVRAASSSFRLSVGKPHQTGVKAFHFRGRFTWSLEKLSQRKKIQIAVDIKYIGFVSDCLSSILVVIIIAVPKPDVVTRIDPQSPILALRNLL